MQGSTHEEKCRGSPETRGTDKWGKQTEMGQTAGRRSGLCNKQTRKKRPSCNSNLIWGICQIIVSLTLLRPPGPVLYTVVSRKTLQKMVRK